jgi:hypothetical protein
MRRVRLEHARQDAAVELPFTPEYARVDPDLRLWRRLDASELSPILRQWIIAAHPRVSFVSETIRDAARPVLDAFFEQRPQAVPLGSVRESREPHLVVGLRADVDAALAKLGVTRPHEIAGAGTAEAWTVPARGSLPPLAVLSAADADALRATARALPHLGSRSYVVFDGPQVIGRGVWPAHGRAIPVVHGR